MMREPISREDIIKVIERKGCGKLPLCMYKWWGAGYSNAQAEIVHALGAEYPDDILILWYNAPGEETSTNDNPSYRWGYKDYFNSKTHSIGKSVELLDDWSELDRFISDFPDPNEPNTFEHLKKEVQLAGDRYKLGGFWRIFHERLWSIRGMENLFCDYYEDIENLKTICQYLVKYYKKIVDRYVELGVDGIFTSDDLGMQTGPMMSPETFEELYLPFYKEFIGYCHSKGLHVFLHSCGDNTLLLPYLVEAGLDVLHPLQAGCMNIKEVADNWGDKITFLAGFDVQHLLPEGTVEDVKQGVTKMLDILWKPEGGLLAAAGNGIMPDCPIENVRATFDLISKYKGKK